MLPPHTCSARILVVVLLALTTLASAERVSAEPSGQYPFQLQGVGWLSGTDQVHVRSVGVLEFDGPGTLVGSRVFIRMVGSRLERLQQALTGTYTVDAAGIMSIDLVAETTATDVADLPGATFALEEICHGVVTDDESQVLLTCELTPEGGTQRGIVSGVAVRESSPGDDELELLREDVESLSVRLCEVLRLLHVPQGQRESHTLETEDACGSTFEWNDRAGR